MVWRITLLIFASVLLALGLGGSMWVSAMHSHVETWTPFGWSAFIGAVLAYAALNECERLPVQVFGVVLGGLLLLSALIGAAIVSVNPDISVIIWDPFGWCGFLGFLALWNSLPNSVTDEIQ